jgi:hypothetical protein
MLLTRSVYLFWSIQIADSVVPEFHVNRSPGSRLSRQNLKHRPAARCVALTLAANRRRAIQ